MKYSNQEAEQRKPVGCGPTPDRVVTCLWLSELCPRHSSCCDHRLPVCIAPAVLPLVLPPRVRGCGGGLVRGDHRGCWFGLVKQINTVMGGIKIWHQRKHVACLLQKSFWRISQTLRVPSYETEQLKRAPFALKRARKKQLRGSNAQDSHKRIKKATLSTSVSSCWEVI